MVAQNAARPIMVPPSEEEPLTQTKSRAIASAWRLQNILGLFKSQSKPETKREQLPPISASRLAAEHDGSTPGTKMYLAYGSNLCYETFQGRRGIRPLAQLNVVVPALRMTFDLPGMPYLEPCFANSARRDPTTPPSKSEYESEEYHKDSWKKGMVGVVYEVTPEDYAHIIATEGGGASYQDIIVKCYPLAVERGEVPEFPQSEAFQAHTLYAPAPVPDDPEHKGGHIRRPDPSYAQPSVRYLKLITDGAEEHSLPKEYKDYLYGIRPYEARSRRTKMGAFIFEMLWLPFFMFFLGLSQKYQDKDGKVPMWVAKLGGIIIGAVWTSYDNMFKPLFGDGERTDYAKKQHWDERESKGKGRHPKRDEEWAEKH